MQALRLRAEEAGRVDRAPRPRPGSAPARSAGVGYSANSAGVTMLTRSSVRLRRQDRRRRAARTGSSDPARTRTSGYSSVSRSITIAARDFAPRGRATAGSGTLAARVPSESCPARKSSPRRLPTGRRSRALDARGPRRDGHPALGDAVWRDLEHPQPDSVGFLARERATRPIAYVHVARSDTFAPRHWVLGLARDPDATRRRRDHRRCSRAAVDARRGTTAAGTRSLWVFEPARRRRRRCSRRAGFEPAARPLPDARPAPARRDRTVGRRHRGAHVRARPRRGRVARGQQPRVRATTPSRAAGSPRRSPGAWPSRGSTRASSCSRSTPTGSPASTG